MFLLETVYFAVATNSVAKCVLSVVTRGLEVWHGHRHGPARPWRARRERDQTGRGGAQLDRPAPRVEPSQGSSRAFAFLETFLRPSLAYVLCIGNVTGAVVLSSVASVCSVVLCSLFSCSLVLVLCEVTYHYYNALPLRAWYSGRVDFGS